MFYPLNYRGHECVLRAKSTEIPVSDTTFRVQAPGKSRRGPSLGAAHLRSVSGESMLPIWSETPTDGGIPERT